MRRILLLCLVIFSLALPIAAQEETSPTPYEIALNRIEEAGLSGATGLNLSALGLSELPPEIGNLRNLEALYLELNQLAQLPPEFGNLTNLIILDLSVNPLTTLPPEFGNLINLREFWFQRSQLQSLPPEFANLQALEILHLDLSNLQNLPLEITKLTALRELYLSDNQLTQLPPEIAQLENLCILDVRFNQLQNLPTELAQIPMERGYRVNNRVEFLCHVLTDGNPLISPPPEVIAEGTPAILAYLRNEAWWHLQRMIVGGAVFVGILAAAFLGLIKWNRRGKQKRKNTA